MSAPDRLPYSHDKFVNRTPEIELVLDKAARLRQKQRVRKRTVIFRGQRGAGKSWLLREIERQLAGLSQALFYLDLEQVLHQAQKQDQVAVQKILELIVTQLGAPKPSPSQKLDEWTTHIVAKISELQEPLILLLDHVDESPREFLALLEERLLGSVINCPHVLLVMAGRGRTYHWESNEMRLRAQYLDLDPFDEIRAREQLSKQVPNALAQVGRILELGAGYPWNNYLLANADGANWVPVLDAIITEMLSPHLESRPYLAGMCVMRSFETLRLAFLLAEFPGLDDREWNHPTCQSVINDLVATSFVRWDKLGYVQDEALRAVLEAHLFLGDRPLWIKLQCAAYCLYKDWANKYPDNPRWHQELKYHLDQLNKAGYGEAECSC